MDARPPAQPFELGAVAEFLYPKRTSSPTTTAAAWNRATSWSSTNSRGVARA